MDQSIPPSERRKIYRSLGCVAYLMKGRVTTVDLRNETNISGMIVNVDGFMNITMENAAYVESEGSYIFFSHCYIPARMIRDIVIPDDMDVVDAVKTLFTPKQHHKEVKKKRTFKMKRSMLQQQETLRLLRNESEK